MLGSPILYLKGMRAIMFQLSGFYFTTIMEFLGNPRKLEHGFRRIGAGFPFSFV